MTPARYLVHVTIDAGHGRRSYRNEAADAVVTIVRQELAEALALGALVDVRPGFRLRADTAGSALLATVMSADDRPLATIAVARKSRDSARLWSIMLERFGAKGDPPKVPWCAVKLHAGLTENLDAAAWLGDYERCLAWAWIEGRYADMAA